MTQNSVGTYSIRPADNLELGLEVYYGADTNQQPVTQYIYDTSINYEWRIISNNDGTYRIMPAISNTKGLDVHNGTDTTMTFNGRSFPKRNGIDVQLYDYYGGDCQKWEFVPVNGVNTFRTSHRVVQGGFGSVAIIPVTQTVSIYRNGNTIYKLEHSASAPQGNETEFILGTNKITVEHVFFNVFGELRRDGVYISQNDPLIREDYAYFTGVLEDSFTDENGTIIACGEAASSGVDAPPQIFEYHITGSQMIPLT